jgi:hypothetical protein
MPHYSTIQAAQLIGVSQSTMERWRRKRGDQPPILKPAYIHPRTKECIYTEVEIGKGRKLVENTLRQLQREEIQPAKMPAKSGALSAGKRRARA